MPDLANKYKNESWKLTRDDKGVTGSSIYIVGKDDVFDLSLPCPGDVWYINNYNVQFPYLKCKNAEWDSLGGDLVQITYHYSTDGQLGDEFFEASMEYGTETVDITQGYTWETAGTPVTINIPTEESVMIYTIKIKNTSSPRNAVALAQKCVNSKVFHEFPVEHLRFDGCSTDNSYGNGSTLMGVKSVYKFVGKTKSHNIYPRPPLQDVDKIGNKRVWQGADADSPDYTTSQNLIGTPVWVAGTAGTGGDDKPKKNGHYRYATCDFAAVLGLPKLLGDG